MNYKYACVLDESGFYRTLVLVLIEVDEQGVTHEVVQNYELGAGERLIETDPPRLKPYVGATGWIRPIWATVTWTEGATPEEIAAWDTAHPAPPPVPPSPTEILQEENKMLRAQITAESDRTDFIEDCIAEIAAQVYV